MRSRIWRGTLRRAGRRLPPSAMKRGSISFSNYSIEPDRLLAYGFQPEGPEYDARIMDVMGRGAFGELKDFDENLLEKSMECGHRSFTIMGGAFEGTEVETRKLAHEATFGVGYGFCIYHVK